MLLWIVRAVYLFVCAGVLAPFIHSMDTSRTGGWISDYPLPAFFGLLILTQLVVVVDVLIRRKRLDLISSIYFGLLIGTLLASVLMNALKPAVGENALVGLLAYCMIPYLCISFLLQTRDDFRFVIPYVEFQKDVKGARPLILDSSALIDGRIADITETKIIDTELVVPDFVLKEIQEIADSSDKVRRGRGRRGLDVLTKLQQNAKAEIRMENATQPSPLGLTVDQRIVALAKVIGGRIVTNDFNLNKVAGVQGVDVVNLNDVAAALRPRYLPGETLKLKIIRAGESIGQGVGYLDDGTMVVCEQAAAMIGKDLDVVVTSVLQNSSGRMIFGRQAGGTGASIPTVG